MSAEKPQSREQAYESKLAPFLLPADALVAPAMVGPLTTRFAPSPTGRMHAGNIFASLVSWLLAKKTGGRVILRIEDLDPERSKQCHIDQVMRDYETLGLDWDEGPFYQSDRDEIYAEAFQTLCDASQVYPCFCTRADIHAASAPHAGQLNVYPGTCRDLSADERAQKAAEAQAAGRLGPSWRLRVPTPNATDDVCAFYDLFQGPCRFRLSRDCGDFVIRRSDLAFAYQLAVVVDDAEQGVSAVARGIDLLDSVPRQEYLQTLLGLPHPTYAHVPILAAADGRRLAKRNKDAGMDLLMRRFGSSEGILGYISGITGLTDTTAPQSLDEILAQFNIAACQKLWRGHLTITWPESE